jgi:hypothetical protein
VEFTAHRAELGGGQSKSLKENRLRRLAPVLQNGVSGPARNAAGSSRRVVPGLAREERKIKIMADETNTGKTELTSPSRRAVVTKAAQVAVTAPAVALLLNAKSKTAFAQIGAGSAAALHILDDFTFGNNEEDIDAAFYGNFNPQNGTTNQDDHV